MYNTVFFPMNASYPDLEEILFVVVVVVCFVSLFVCLSAHICLEPRKDLLLELIFCYPFMLVDSDSFIQVLRREQRNISERYVYQLLSIQPLLVNLPGKEKWSSCPHDSLNPHGLGVEIKVNF